MSSIEYLSNPADHMEAYLLAPPSALGILFAMKAVSLQVIG
jgi:hypothetical protein